MKRIVFLVSHLYSGSGVLFDAMNQHRRIQGFRISVKKPFLHLLNLLAFTERKHKFNNSAAMYMDELLFNYSFCTKVAYKDCKFIYVIREPRPTLNSLVADKIFKPLFACRYYCYRLERLCEMAKRTPGAVLLTWDDLFTGRGIKLIEKYLKLKEPIDFNPNDLGNLQKKFSSELVAYDLLKKAEESYEKYLYFLKNQKLVYWE